MKNTRVLVAIAVTLLAVVAIGVLYAQPKEMPKAGKSIKIEKSEEMDTDMPGMMMPDMPPDVQKKLIEQQMKLVKETSPLRADLEQKQLEMRLLWLDDEPNADKIVAKLSDINKVEMQLKEKEIRNRLAIHNLLPTEMRKNFLRGCCGGMGQGMSMMGPGTGMCPCGGTGMCHMGMGAGKGMGQGMMGGMGMGPQMRIEKRVIKKGPGAGGMCPGCGGDEE